MRTSLLIHAATALALAACNTVDAGTARSGAIAVAAPCPLAINEVAAAGEPADWFEVVNVSSAPLDLAGFAFVDRATDRALAAPLPASILAPGARHVEEVTARTGFRLGGTDALYLYRAGDTVPCDGVRWEDGDAPRGASFARVPDGAGRFETTEPDTRGVSNR